MRRIVANACLLEKLSEDEKSGLAVKSVFLVGEVLRRRGFVEPGKRLVLGDAEVGEK